jgi:hypothetical protein
MAIARSTLLKENQGMIPTVSVRAAKAPDAGAIASIYNEGITERAATFETEPRQARDFLARVASERHPLLVAELDEQLVGWAGLSPTASDKPMLVSPSAASTSWVGHEARELGPSFAIGWRRTRTVAVSTSWSVKFSRRTWRACGWSAAADFRRSAYTAATVAWMANGAMCC